MADLNFQSSQRALETARAGEGFQLSSNTNYTLTNPIEPPLPGQNTLRVGANASVGVLPWSTAADSARSAVRNLEQASLSRQEARNSLVINLHTLYFALRLASQDREIAQNTLKLRETQVRAVTVQNQNGQATREAVLQAQQSLEQAQLAQLGAIGTLQLAQLNLGSALGVSPLGLSAPTAPSAVRLPTTSLDELIRQALSRRPDVLQAQIALQSAQEALGNRQFNRWLPDTNVSLGFSEKNLQNRIGSQLEAGLNLKSGFLSLGGSVPLVDQTLLAGSIYNRSWNFGLSLSFPLFDPVAEARVGSSANAVELAGATLEAAQSAAALDVRQKHLELQTELSRIEVARASLALAKQTLETNQARLQAGLTTALEVQSRQIAFDQAERDLEASQAQAQIAWLKLQNALGISLIGGSQ